MKPSKDARRYYRALRDDLQKIVAEQIESEDDSLNAISSLGFSRDSISASRMHPGRVEMLNELISVLDHAFDWSYSNG